MQIRATYDGKDYELPGAGIVDFVAFERHYGLPATVFSPIEEMNEKGEMVDKPNPAQRFEHLCFLVWRGLKKLGAIDGTVAFDDAFLDKLDEVILPEGEEDEDAPDPTATAAPSAPAA